MRSSELEARGRVLNITKTGVNVRPRDSIAAVTKRLAHRNANVQLYALTVASLCGVTNDSLLNLLVRTAAPRSIEKLPPEHLLKLLCV